MHDFITHRMFVSCALVLGSLVAGCAGDDGSADGASSTATVVGRLAAADGSVDVIEAYRLEGDGSLTRISEGAPPEDGTYELVIDVSAAGAAPILIRAEGGGQVQGSVLVFASSAIDGIITAAPIDAETTVESDVFASIQLEVLLDTSGVATLRLLVDETLAGSLAESDAYASDIHATAEGVVAASTAFERALSAQTGADAEAQLGIAADALARAQARLDEALNDAETSADASVALSVYAEAYVAAYLDAGFSAEEVSAAAHAAVASVDHFAAELTAEAQAAAEAQAHAVLALAVSASVEAEMQAMGASHAAVEALANARAELEARVAAAVSLGEAARAEILAAWAEYAAVVEAELNATLGATAQLLATLAAETSDLEASLSATVAGASGDAEAIGESIGDAHAHFYADATAESRIETLTTLGVAHADADAALSVLAEIALADQ